MKKILIYLICSIAIQGCFSSVSEQSDISAASWSIVVNKILSKTKSAQTFRKLGPFKVSKIEDYKLNINPKKSVTTDLFLPKHSSKSPLIVMVHGNKFNKLVHGRQCQRLSSWGFHCLAVEVPNRNQWLQNGKTIGQLVDLIHGYPNLISPRLDIDKIILIGHSFGGSAVTIAAGRGAPVAGLILLDPAVVHQKVKKYMQKIAVPVILLGADPTVFASRKRKLFYKNILGPMSEVTVTGATHNDAQFPSINTVKWGFDLRTTKNFQEIFLQSIIASAFSISSSADVDYAWKAFGPYLKNGKLKSGRVRSARQITNEKTR